MDKDTNLTAYEWLEKHHKTTIDDIIAGSYGSNIGNINSAKALISKWLKQYAKIHCEAQLKAILETKYKSSVGNSLVEHTPNAKEAIIAAYDLNNII